MREETELTKSKPPTLCLSKYYTLLWEKKKSSHYHRVLRERERERENLVVVGETQPKPKNMPKPN